MTFQAFRLQLLLDGWANVKTENRFKWRKGKMQLFINDNGLFGYIPALDSGGFSDQPTNSRTDYREIYERVLKMEEQSG